ncbi:MAG: class I SAM-dependent methyltransferase [Candidatus Tectomicrobia bacterium]|nr:class I SAM-dependent methyltransferase [Candidatus Tectomicrobia bacterium]
MCESNRVFFDAYWRRRALISRLSFASRMHTATIRHLLAQQRRAWEGRHILEIGAGVTTLLFTFPRAHLALVDVAESARAYAGAMASRRRVASFQAAASLGEVRRPQGRFDLIIMAHVLEHLDDAAGMISQLCGWLAPAGLLVVQVPTNEARHPYCRERRIGFFNPLHVHKFTWESLTQTLAQAGLEVVAACANNRFLTLLELPARYWLYRALAFGSNALSFLPFGTWRAFDALAARRLPPRQLTLLAQRRGSHAPVSHPESSDAGPAAA